MKWLLVVAALVLPLNGLALCLPAAAACCAAVPLPESCCCDEMPGVSACEMPAVPAIPVILTGMPPMLAAPAAVMPRPACPEGEMMLFTGPAEPARPVLLHSEVWRC